MAKGVKRVAQESNRKSRYETEGYKRSEQRKKITRRINNLRNNIESGKISGAANISNANALIDKLESMKKASYINRSTKKYTYSEEQLENVIRYASGKKEEIELDVAAYKPSNKELFAMREYNIDAKTQFRRNKLFEQEINQASLSSEIGVSSLSKSEVKIFYASTMEFWQGKDALSRNQYIMDALGVKSLEEAFDIIMGTQEAQDALQRAGKEQEIETEKSPDYIDYLLSMIDV